MPGPNTMDLLLLARIVHHNRHDQRPIASGHGEHAAAMRLERAGLIHRDLTRTIKPYVWCPTTKGFEMAEKMVQLIEAV